MECLYSPHLKSESTNIILDSDESKHAKVLRLREHDLVLVSSGTGTLAKARIIEINQGLYTLSIEETRYNVHELSFRFGIALPLLSSKDRMEYVIEKLTELGITDIYPIISDRVQVHSFDVERLNAKAIAAMKQSKRSILPTLHALEQFSSLSDIAATYSTIIMGDIHGNTEFPKEDQLSKDKGLLLCIGPEGGFSEHEMSLLRSIPNIFPIRLGHSRLRAETAALALAAISSFHFD